MIVSQSPWFVPTLLIGVDDAAAVALALGGASALGSLMTGVWALMKHRKDTSDRIDATLSDGTHVTIDSAMPADEIAAKAKAIAADVSRVARRP